MSSSSREPWIEDQETPVVDGAPVENRNSIAHRRFGGHRLEDVHQTVIERKVVLDYDREGKRKKKTNFCLRPKD